MSYHLHLRLFKRNNKNTMPLSSPPILRTPSEITENILSGANLNKPQPILDKYIAWLTKEYGEEYIINNFDINVLKVLSKDPNIIWEWSGW